MTTSRGELAEQLVVDRLRAVLPDDVLLLHNVSWLMKDHGYVREGEADVVIGDPDRGILVVEVKAGEVRRERDGTWYAGGRLPRSPFEQAKDSRHTLVRKLIEQPGWQAGLVPISGQAVAFPDVDMDSMGPRLNLLGLDAETELIADQSMFVDGDEGRAELRGFVDRAFELWRGKSGERPPGRDGIDLLRATMTAPLEIRSMLRFEIATGQAETVRLTTGQYQLLSTLRGVRRAAIVGGAGTGKTMLAAEKARRLAREGFSTLLVCFNAPLARALGEDTREVADATGQLTVTTFHQLCQDLGREAGVLGERPDPVPQSWWDETLPRALDEAVERLGPRFHAIVVDEGQDFDVGWLASLEELSIYGRDDVMYVFHDPAQAIYREDVVDQLGLQEYPLELNCRNPQPIHDLVRQFAGGGLESIALRTDGRSPELIEADGDAATLEALRKVLHRLRNEEGVAPWDIAVLTGVRLEHSAVWRQRTFGNEALANPSVDDAGHHLGLAAGATPDLPSDAILCETIRRFKGLERPVIALVELKPDDDRLDQHLYVGASRARQHLVVIAPPAVVERLR
jgi:hypothetical protein